MINIKDWTSDIISGDTRMAMPIMTHPGIDMIGKNTGQAVRSGVVHAAAIRRLNDTYPSVAATMMMDLTVEAEAFGCSVEFQENEMPHIKNTIVSNYSSVEKLNVPDLSCGRLPEYLMANKLVIDSIEDKPVFGGVIGPFSLAGRLFGMSEIMMACYMEPETVELLLQKCTEFILSYAKELKRNGSSGVVIAEPAAGLLSNEQCLQFSSVYIRKIVDALQDHTFLVILHNCGNRGHCTEAMLESGADALHFGNAIDMVSALDYCPSDKLIMGNVDPVGVMKMMSPENVKQYVTELLGKTTNYRNYVLSTGCDLPPHVPKENIDAFFSALTTYNLLFEYAPTCEDGF